MAEIPSCPGCSTSDRVEPLGTFFSEWLPAVLPAASQLERWWCGRCNGILSALPASLAGRADSGTAPGPVPGPKPKRGRKPKPERDLIERDLEKVLEQESDADAAKQVPKIGERGRCRVCGCSDRNCRLCARRVGHPCSWMDEAETLCSACAPLLEADLGKVYPGEGSRPILPIRSKLPRRLKTVGDLLELDACHPPKGLSGDQVALLGQAARGWLHDQLQRDEEGNALIEREADAEDDFSSERRVSDYLACALGLYPLGCVQDRDDPSDPLLNKHRHAELVAAAIAGDEALRQAVVRIFHPGAYAETSPGNYGYRTTSEPSFAFGRQGGVWLSGAALLARVRQVLGPAAIHCPVPVEPARPKRSRKRKGATS